MSRRNAGRTSREYPRTLRLNQLIHEIVADELERVDDDRLGLVTIMSVEVEPDLRRAVVHFDTLAGMSGDESADDDALAAFGEIRVRLQAAIGRQARTKRVPELRFVPDKVERQAGRVEDILRDLKGVDDGPALDEDD